MPDERFVNQLAEALLIIFEHFGTLCKRETLRAVAAVIRYMAGGLIGQQINVDVAIDGIFQQVDNVAIIGDGEHLFLRLCLLDPSKCLIKAVGNLADPALTVTGFDAGRIDLGHNADAARNFNGFGLCATHAAKTGRHKQVSAQIAIRRDTQHLASNVEQRIKGSMHDALRADVHPAAGRHLSVA
ncbi:hypothetical protein DSECCO2_550220 [anaerobic digester metagenome]